MDYDARNDEIRDNVTRDAAEILLQLYRPNKLLKVRSTVSAAPLRPVLPAISHP
jgi:hypothetical protein